MSEQCEENPILARARTAIENGEAVNRVSALVARIEELEAAIERVRERHGWTDTTPLSALFTPPWTVTHEGANGSHVAVAA